MLQLGQAFLLSNLPHLDLYHLCIFNLDSTATLQSSPPLCLLFLPLLVGMLYSAASIYSLSPSYCNSSWVFTSFSGVFLRRAFQALARFGSVLVWEYRKSFHHWKNRLGSGLGRWGFYFVGLSLPICHCLYHGFAMKILLFYFALAQET